ncbi:hypothetical protein [Lysinibacillus sp. fls2-241-R2A-57]|uniref:hypothetical protein n=1 Tax=Lysinibacillus sp. fls2-241-R2A-57 TaxID=3040292 RepID=UPI002553F411|nr:hypothetical protein [Lysinibacillus sp. fls2-241-R2A-57]
MMNVRQNVQLSFSIDRPSPIRNCAVYSRMYVNVSEIRLITFQVAFTFNVRRAPITLIGGK